MFPERIPHAIQTRRGRAAERRVYQLLQQQLSDAYSVFLNVSWVSGGGTATDGEIDFVVAHPERGLLVLEVKGGVLRRERGQWYSTNQRGESRRLSSGPLEQAQDAQYALLRQLKRHSPFADHFIPCLSAVVLTSVSRPASESLGIDSPDDRFIFSDDLEQLGARVAKLLTQARRAAPAGFGTERLQALEDRLGPTFRLRQPLSVLIRENERIVEELTEEQFEVLDALVRQRRVAVGGAAGTGKTQLALEQAARLARNGENVLITCHTPTLAVALRAVLWRSNPELMLRGFRHPSQASRGYYSVSYGTLDNTLYDTGQPRAHSDAFTGPGSIEVLSFSHYIQIGAAARADEVKFPDYESWAQLDPELNREFRSASTFAGTMEDWALDKAHWDLILPDRVARAYQEHGRSRLGQEGIAVSREAGEVYDAVLVDEGHHFSVDEWRALEQLLRDVSGGLFYAFWDEYQNYTEVSSGVSSLNCASYTLRRNLRNSRAIAALASRWYNGEIAPAASGPEGRPIEYVTVEDESDWGYAISDVLDRLIRDEKVARGDILVLDGGWDDDARLWRAVAHIDEPLVALDPNTAMLDLTERVVYASCADVGGLERSVVILVGVSSITRPELLYVALSRARHHLVVVGTEAEIERVAANRNGDD